MKVAIFKGNKRIPYIEKEANYSEPEDRIAKRLALAARIGDRIKIDERTFRVTGRHEVEEKR